jgi:hypothetical protein
MNSTTNDDDKVNDDMTWKVVRTGNSNTPLRKPKHYEQGQQTETRENKLSSRTLVTKMMVYSGKKFTVAQWKYASCLIKASAPPLICMDKVRVLTSSSTFCCCYEYLFLSTSMSDSFFLSSLIPSNTGNDSLVSLIIDSAVVASKF